MGHTLFLSCVVAFCLCLLGAGCSDSDNTGDPDAGQGSEDSDTSDTNGGTDSDTAPAPEEATYCDTPMLKLPEDPAAPGPWAVGARTIDIDDLHAEVWYPAELGSAASQEKLVYDLREYLPQNQQDSVDENTTIMQPCECYRDLPIDGAHGPYPVIVFAHGMSGFKGQSLEFVTHWASRGFVVLSSDAPSIGLRTFLEIFSGNSAASMQALLDIIGSMGTPSTPGGACDPSGASGQTGDLVFVLESLEQPSGDLAFLEGHIDLQRVGASGHSAGGNAVYSLGGHPGVKVVVPQAAGGTCDGASLVSTLVIGGMADSIVQYASTKSGYQASPTTKRLIGLSKAGHMAMTSFCPIGEDEGGIIEAAKNAGVKFNPLFEAFIKPLASDGCGPNSLPAERGWEIINFASTAAFEEILMCIPERGAKLGEIQSLYPEVGEYVEDL